MAVEFRTDVTIKENVEPRLISSIQRTGRVYAQDDFEAYTSALTEKWEQVSGTIALDTTAPLRGKSAAKLTTGNVAGNIATMGKHLGLVPKGRMGIELWLRSVSGIANLRRIDIAILYYDGTNLISAIVRYLGTVTTLQQKWQYSNSAGVYTDIPGGAQILYVESGYPTYHHIKLVADFTNTKYVKLICNDRTFDLSALAMQSAASALGPFLYIYVAVCTETATAVNLFVDDVVWTDQEP